MEEVQKAAFATEYLTIQNKPKPNEYASYGITITAVPVTESGDIVQMQKITVNITRNSRAYPLEDYKVDR